MSPRILSDKQKVSLAKAREKSLEVRRLGVKHSGKIQHPRDVLISHLDHMRWTTSDLAGRLSFGDDDKAPARNACLISHYLTHPTGDLYLWSFAGKIEQALSLPKDTIRKVEKKWIESRRVDQV